MFLSGTTPKMFWSAITDGNVVAVAGAVSPGARVIVGDVDAGASVEVGAEVGDEVGSVVSKT